ncbi:MAG: penicillin acylase family protein [Pseudomonadota bacterium]
MKKTIVAVLLVVIALAGAASVYLIAPSRSFDRTAALERGELYDVRIVRDAFGVPHIYGDRDVDAAFGFAYAQAEDNIANIEQSFAFARGEMGKQSGEDGAKTDYLIAAMRVRETFIEKYEKDLSSEVRAVLDAYADGINYFCAQEVERCSPGFAPLTGREVASAPKTRGPFVFGLNDILTELFDENANFESDELVMPNVDTSGYASYVGMDTSIIGSNAIAVSPSRSSDGYTRLYSNAHQPFVGPTALYEARIKSSEGWDIYGAFVSGSPFAIFGANPDLAWTITVSQPDLIDVYRLEVDDPDNPTKYRFDSEWRDLEISTVKLRVKLAGPFSLPVEQDVYHSVHGPVLKTPHGWFAISFAGYGDIQSIAQLYEMNRAKTQKQWLRAMHRQGVAAFNIIYADKTGNIAYYYNAKAPVRSEKWDWSKVAPGNSSEFLWSGYHPFKSVMPYVENPKSGFVVSANHDPYHVTGANDNLDPSDFPAHLGVISETSNRGLRIFRLFNADPSISREEILAYKMDARYAPDSYLMQLLGDIRSNPAIADEPEFEKALELLAAWDGNTEIASREVALATRIGHLLLGIQLNPTKSRPSLTDPVKAVRQAIAELNKGFGRIDPTWGEVNRLKRGEIDLPIRGGPDVLRAIYSTDNPNDGPMSAIAGDSLQFLIEWDPKGKMAIQSIYHFGANKWDASSPHYADQATLFATEKFRTPPITLEKAIAEATSDYNPLER